MKVSLESYSRKCVVCPAVKLSSGGITGRRAPYCHSTQTSAIRKQSARPPEIGGESALKHTGPRCQVLILSLTGNYVTILNPWPRKHGAPGGINGSSWIGMTSQRTEDVKGSREMTKQASVLGLNAFVPRVRIYLVMINFICGYLLFKVFETVWHVRVSDKLALKFLI